MLLFPVRTDRPLRSTPVINYALIALNVIIFVLTMRQIGSADAWLRDHPSWDQAAVHFPVVQYYLHPTEPSLIQFLSSVFLHADLWHLLGNMVFLYVFGNSVEDRLGKLGYLFFYLAGGVFAALGHVMVETTPVLGASGAVCAVTGAYLALFPLSRVTVLFFMLIVGFLEVPSIGLILLFFIQDALKYLSLQGGVAYLAHMSGSVYGFLLGMMLLWTRILPREPYDMMSLWEHRRRRSQFRALTQQGFEPWQNRAAQRDVAATPEAAPTPAEIGIMEKRAEISRALAARHHDRAAELYAELLDLDGDQVLGQQAQIDLANYLAAAGRHDLAARMYELYLNNYRSTGDREQIELMLALLYVRYLKRWQRARELLTAAMPRLRNAQEKALAEALLQQMETA